VPLLYYVDRLREGRTYATRTVRAVQNGNVVFVMLCSFQKPEFWQPSRQWPMPQGVPPPEECTGEVEYIKSMAERPGTSEEVKARLMGYAIVRSIHIFSLVLYLGR
jgi:acyl-CoA thioesterase II